MSPSFIGLDVGRYTIDVFVLSQEREKVAAFTISQTHQGYEQLIDFINQRRTEADLPLVAAEGHDGNLAPLDGYLLAEGITVLSVHPTAVNRHKDYLGQRQKTDAYDAYVIADLLFFQHQRLDPLQSEALSRELKSLSRTYKTLTKTQTRLSNQLQQELMAYFPELLNEPIFSSITGNAALNLLIEYPTPEQLRKLSIEELSAFLAVHSKNHLGDKIAREVLRRAACVSRTPVEIESKALIVSLLARQLLLLNQSLIQLRKQLDQKTKASIPLQRLVSVPGISCVLASRLIGEVVEFSRFASESKLAMFCGLAPVSQDSGLTKGRHRTTHRVNKVAKDALIQAAACSAQVSAVSKQYYQKKRKEGKSHWQALKCLARQLVRVIWAMFRDGTQYQLS